MVRTLLILMLFSSTLAAQDRPKMTPKRTDVKPFEYVEADIPFYPPGGDRKGDGPKPKMQKPLSPEESMKHFVTPEGFEVRLFASEPQIRRPICMNWDERGRLWIAESIDYPNERKNAGEGRDRIVICEDTDGDGEADKFTVFADKLSVPTGFTFYKGGIIVVQAPDTLYLKDTTGDDVADERRVLFTGWGLRDTHAGPSNLHWGFDNWIYGIVGYSGFDGVVGGEKHKFNQGFFRFTPDGAKLEFLRSTNNNSWGLGFSEEGHLFGSTANGNPSMHMAIPNRYYERVRGWSAPVLGGIAGNPDMEVITDKIRQVDQHGRFTAACGHALYTARTYPKEYWNRTAFVCEPTGHLVATFVLEPDGASFKSRMAWNLLASDDEWSAPIMAEVGPDGNVWVIDWYNFIVQHNPTPAGFKTGPGNAYETNLRDKTHGRIYRIVPKNAKPTARVTLKDATPEKLVATLGHDNMFWRKHAQRLLVERGKKDVVPALVKLVEDRGESTHGMIHALWTLHGLAALDENRNVDDALVWAMSHNAPAVRATAINVHPRSGKLFSLHLRRARWQGQNPQVMLAEILALTEMDGANEGILERGIELRNALIDEACTCLAARDAAEFLIDYLDVGEGEPLAPSSMIERIAEHYARSPLHGLPERHSLAKLILATREGRVASVQVAVVRGLANGWPKGVVPPEPVKVDEALKSLAQRFPVTARGDLARLTTRMGSRALDGYFAELAKSYLATVKSPRNTESVRIFAANQFIELSRTDPGAPRELLDMLSLQMSDELAHGLLDAVGRSEAPTTAKELLAVLPRLTPGNRTFAVRILLQRTDGAAAILDAIDKGQVPLGDLNLEQKQALANHPTRTIAEKAKALLAKQGGLPNPDRQRVIEELTSLTKASGDAVKGRAVFKAQCAKCHQHTGEGANIGPDLTGMAVHSKEHLLTEILDPSRSVEGNFRQYVVTLKSGKILNGLLASESKTALDILDSEAKKHSVQRDDIDEIQATNKSLMPEGFEKQIKKEELADLLEFLTTRGQFTPLPLGKVATVVSTLGMFGAKDSTAERLIFADWGPKTFKGVPFVLVDPQGERVPNVLLMHGPNGTTPPTMPKSVRLAWGAPAKSVHLLSGVSGWGHPIGKTGSVSLIVRLHYASGKTEDHPLRNGEHFADYIRRIDVPGSEFAFALRNQQIRYLRIDPKEADVIREIEFVKGPDQSAPIVMAVTVEKR